MRNAPAAHQFDTGVELLVARAQGDFMVHLVAPGQNRAACGRALRSRAPHKSFREAGCGDCLASALREGRVAARESDRVWINLLRV